jgi:hypothetical protein
MRLGSLAPPTPKMVVIIEVVDRANIEPGLIDGCDVGRGLVEDFSADRQLIRDLALQEPAEEPVILVAELLSTL